jgi:hypothetical protein
MIEALIKFLISLCVLVLCVFLVLWVTEAIGLLIPVMVVKIIWVIVALIAILLLVRFLRPFVGSWFP